MTNIESMLLKNAYRKYFKDILVEMGISTMKYTLELVHGEAVRYIVYENYYYDDLYEEIKIPVWGQYNNKTKHTMVAIGHDTEMVLNTIRHEARHIYQYVHWDNKLIEHDEQHNSYKNSLLEVDARDYADNYKGHVVFEGGK